MTGVTLSLYSGVLSTGLGDMVAAVIGSKWGSHRWPGKWYIHSVLYSCCVLYMPCKCYSTLCSIMAMYITYITYIIYCNLSDSC